MSWFIQTKTAIRGSSFTVVRLNDYVYLIPFVTQDDGTAFLKTIIPSRKATRDYLGR